MIKSVVYPCVQVLCVWKLERPVRFVRTSGQQVRTLPCPHPRDQSLDPAVPREEGGAQPWIRQALLLKTFLGRGELATSNLPHSWSEEHLRPEGDQQCTTDRISFSLQLLPLEIHH